MVDPINYGALLTQIDLSGLQRGLQLRSNNRAQEAEAQRQESVRQLAQQKFEVDRKEHAEYLAAVDAYKANPTPTGLRDLGIRFPDQAQALQKAGDSYTASQKQDLIGAGFGALGAISAGKSDVAVKTLQDRVTALQGAGIDTSHTQAAIDMLKSGDVKGATAYLSYAMGGLVGADHAAGVLETLGVGGKAEDRRADNERQDRALEVRERQADAAIARGEAASARAERAADRADRREARGSSGGGGDSYEYRIGPDGKLQRRKR